MKKLFLALFAVSTALTLGLSGCAGMKGPSDEELARQTCDAWAAALLAAAAARALAAAAMQERLMALAITPNVQPPEAWAAYQAAESAKLGGVIRSRNIQVQ